MLPPCGKPKCLQHIQLHKVTHNMSIQAQISHLEQGHAQRLLDVAARHHQEMDLQTQRLRESQQQSQSILESREKAHRQRVRGLEGQVHNSPGGLPQPIRNNTPSSSLLLAAADTEGSAGAGSQEAARTLDQQGASEPNPSGLYISSYIHVWRRVHSTGQGRSHSPLVRLPLLAHVRRGLH